MPDPLRITIVQGAFLPVPPLLGGAVEKAWFALGAAFADAGCEVTHVSRAHPQLPPEEHRAGVRHVRVAGFDTPRALWKLKLLDLRYSWRARRVLPPAHILITNTFWLPLLERRRSRGHLYVHVARYPKGQLRFYPARAALQTVSAPIRRAILREVPGATDRVRVVPYPLAPAYLTPPAAAENVILYAGRVHSEKGVHLLIEAFARLGAAGDGWRLRLVGPWETRHGGGGETYRDELRRLAGPVAARVDFVGPVFDEAALVAHYRAAAVFCYPSLAERGETFGLAVLEAMGSGCAPVVSALECFRDFIVPRQNGLIFDHRAADPVAALASALGELAGDAQLREQLRVAARQSAGLYALPRVAQLYLDDFLRLRAN